MGTELSIQGTLTLAIDSMTARQAIKSMTATTRIKYSFTIDDRVDIMPYAFRIIKVCIAVWLFPATASAQFTAQEISFLCAGGLSTRFDAEDAATSSTDNGIRILDQNGSVTVLQGDKIIDTFEGATYVQYVECLKTMSGQSSNEPSIPRYDGEIRFTYGNDRSFLNFLESNVDKVVFLGLSMNYEFGLSESYEIEAKCNPDNGIWDHGLSGVKIHLPLGSERAGPGEISCAEMPFSFSGKEFDLSSAGPGTHWFDLTGFYRVAWGAGRWPFFELSAMNASADMWSRLSN